MKKTKPHSGTRLSRQALELSMAAPQVVATRLVRMVLAGANPSARDQREFHQMGSEKVTAFYQSWSAMWTQYFTSQFVIAQTLTSLFTTAWLGGRQPDAASAMSAMTRESGKIMSAGLAPVHRKAVSNARRLSKVKQGFRPF